MFVVEVKRWWAKTRRKRVYIMGKVVSEGMRLMLQYLYFYGCRSFSELEVFLSKMFVKRKMYLIKSAMRNGWVEVRNGKLCLSNKGQDIVTKLFWWKYPEYKAKAQVDAVLNDERDLEYLRALFGSGL